MPSRGSPGQSDRGTRGAWNDRSGHIDNSLTIWIVLVIVVIAGARLYQLKTGSSVSDLLASVPGTWWAFLARTAVLVGVGAAAGFAAGSREGPDLLRVEYSDARAVLRVRDTATRVVGIFVILIALHSLHFAWALGGVTGWVIGAGGAVLGFLGFAATTGSRRVVVEEGRVAFESGGGGMAEPLAEHTWKPGSRPEVVADSHTTGGAFGQPLRVHERGKVGDTVLYEGPRKDLAEALAEAVAEALEHVAGASATNGSS
jgi:hypothetical protein